MMRRLALIACIALLGLGWAHNESGHSKRRARATSTASPADGSVTPPIEPSALALFTDRAVSAVGRAALPREPEQGRGIAASAVRAPAGGKPALVRLQLNRHDRVAIARWMLVESSAALRNGGQLDADTFALAQTVRGFATFAGKSHARALRMLSPHVAGDRPALVRRHALYRQLPAHGTAKPALWDDARDGKWSVYGPAWAAFRDGVDDAVVSGFEPVCATDPIAEGAAGDAHIARARGFVRVGCGDKVEFWARPETVIDAAVAAGGVR